MQKSKYNVHMTAEVQKGNSVGELYPEDALTAITTIDGRYKKDVIALSQYASEMGLQSVRTEIEAKHLIGLSTIGVIRPLTQGERDHLLEMGQGLTLAQARRIKELEAVSDHDVQAVEKRMREELLGTSLSDVTWALHYPLTSEDPNNLSYRLMFVRGSEKVALPVVDQIIDNQVEEAERDKGIVMQARTHGQPAVSTTLGKEKLNFAIRLNKEVNKLRGMRLTGKLNGAVGNFNAHFYSAPHIDWQQYAKEFVEGLGFEYNPYTTQINPYEDLIEMFQGYQRLNGILMDFDQDMWRYISDAWISQQTKSGETYSSTMAQKVNPIRFENSEGNLFIANTLFEGFSRKLAISRLQRDLSDSTVIRNAPTALAFSLLAYTNTLRGLGRVEPDAKVINQALNADWSTLTEGVQVYLRTQGRDDAYDLVKEAARGVRIGPENWSEWVQGLDITKEQKKHILTLNPEEYVGIAEEITEQGIAEIKRSRESKGIAKPEQVKRQKRGKRASKR